MKKFFKFFIFEIMFFLLFFNIFELTLSCENNSFFIKKKKIIELNINNALTIALINNPNIEIFTLKIKQAKEKMNNNFYYYWPDVNLNMSYFADNSKNFNKNESLNHFILESSFSWLIFDTFKKRFLFAISEYDKQIAIETLKSAKKDLLLSVSDIFYRAQFFKENLRTFISNEKFYKKTLEEYKEKFRLGMCSLSEVLNFEIRLNNAKIMRIEEEEKYKISMLHLSSVLGFSDSKFPYFIKLIKTYPIEKEELEKPRHKNLLKFIINRNSNVKISKLNLKKFYSKIRINKINNFPQIHFNATLKTENAKKIQKYNHSFNKNFLLKISYNFFPKIKNNFKNNEFIEIKNQHSKIIKKTFISEKTRIGEVFLEICYSQSQFLFQRENLNLIKQAKTLLEKEYKKKYTSYNRLNQIQNEFIVACKKFYFLVFKLRLSLIKLTIITTDYNLIK